ncbi:MAG: helix-turn-helix domain-containing protein, partial [Lachnospiraceae bacterium]
MLSNQVLLKTINRMKDITDCNISIWNMEMKCLAHTGIIKTELNTIIDHHWEAIKDGEELIGKDYAIFTAYEELQPIYVLTLEGIGSNAAIVGRLCISQLEGLIAAYKERLDKNYFIQNLLLDKLLMVDIYNKAKWLKISVEERRIVFIIEPKKEEDSIIMETLKGLYATSYHDFITSMDEGHIIFVKTLLTTDGENEIRHIANTIKDTLSAEAMVSVRVAYGMIVHELSQISQSYKEAKMALEIGRIFYAQRNVLDYGKLGIGRLIYQLPESLCQIFLEEVLEGKAIDQFDEETLVTVYKFFENNLNISETARQLYIHRNTLVYKLDKIQKATGLD